jgi:4,4'-dithiodibutanoate disulfide reductase
MDRQMPGRTDDEGGASDGPFSPYQLGPVTLRNRIVKAATFEGVMPRGRVTDDLINFHTRVADGGAAMTTVAYCAVSPGGRVHRHTVVMNEDSLPGLQRLTAAVHERGAAVAAQLGHAGLVADVRSNRTPSLAPSTRFSPVSMARVKGAGDAELDTVVADFTRATTVAAEAGFDSVEVHLGHGYLLSSFLSPNLNRRKDRYGGSIENRSQFPRRVLEAVRETAGDRMAVTAKLNMVDGVRKGLQLDESLQVAKLLEQDGHVDALQLTGGSSLLNSMYLFRGDVPMKEMAATQPRAIGLGMRAIGRWMFRAYPFEEAYFLPAARQFRAETTLPLMLLGGINRRDTITGAVDEGFELVAMARALLREPDLPRRMADAQADEATCIHCNRCMPTIYSGTRCVLEEPALRP